MTYRPIALPAYLVGATITLIPVYDALMSVAPPHVHDARWRFGALGLLSNAAMMPALGLLIVFAIAVACEHRRLLRALGWVSVFVAGAGICALAVFLLDALQTQGAVRSQMLLSFQVATITAVVKSVIAIATFGAFGSAGIRFGKRKLAAAPIPLHTVRGSAKTSA